MNDDDLGKREPVFGQQQAGLELYEDDQRSEVESNTFNKAAGVGSHTGGKGSGSGKALVFVLLLGLVALGWFAWQQSVEQAVLSERFEELASKINSTDESLNQSGAAISLRLKDQSAELEKQWSEIKKLWGVANDRNRKTLDEHKALLATHTNTLKKTSTSVASVKTTANKLGKKIDSVSKDIQTLKSDSLASSAEIEDVRGEFNASSSSVKRLEQQVMALGEQLSRSRSDNEKAMAAVDSFRRQTNQQLQMLQEQLTQP